MKPAENTAHLLYLFGLSMVVVGVILYQQKIMSLTNELDQARRHARLAIERAERAEQVRGHKED